LLLPVGTITITVTKENYIPRCFSWTVTSGVCEVPTIGISTQNLIEGQVTHHLMTMDEILAAGIDISAAGNQQIYEYETKLRFRPEFDWLSLMTYFLPDGTLLGCRWGDGDFSPNTGSGGGGGSGSGGGGGSASGESGYYFHSGSGGPGTGRAFGWGFVYTTPEGEDLTIYPVSEEFYLIIHGEVRWLKEMFDVELLVMNHSMTDTIEDCSATLLLEDGISLAEMVGEKQTLTQDVGSVESGGTRSYHWYVRGDKEGVYSPGVLLQGIMQPLGEEFSYNYTAHEPMKVYAGSAMHMTYDIPDSAFTGDDYTIRITLENVSNRTLYGVSHTIKEFKEGQVTYYSDGSEVRKETLEASGSISTPVFRPGDKIVIELTANIWWESEVIKYKLQKMMGMIDGAQSLMGAYDCVKKSTDLLNSLTSFIQTANSNLDKIISAGSLSGTDKEKAASELAKAVQKLYGQFGKGKSGVLKTIDKMQETELAGVIDEIAEASDLNLYFTGKSALEIAKLADKLNAVADAGEEVDVSEFNKYEAVKTAISLIPIRYVLQDITVTTLDTSTTTIPYSFNIQHVGPRYFGVDNVGKYLYNLVIACMGEIDTGLLGKLAGVEDPSGYREAVKYVTAVQNEAQKFAAADSSKGGKFRAWIEPAGTKSLKNAPARMKKASGLAASTGEEPDFTLSVSNNDTGTLSEDGVLEFTGEGIIEVTPNRQTNGILHIEMYDEDGTKLLSQQNVIAVAAPHTCSGTHWTTELEPSADSEGYQMLCCDTCGDILDVRTTALCEGEHVFGEETEELAATCQRAGIMVRSCEACGHAMYTFTDKTDHVCENWVVAAEPQIGREGLKTGTCKYCGEEMSEVIPALEDTSGGSGGSDSGDSGDSGSGGTDAGGSGAGGSGSGSAGSGSGGASSGSESGSGGRQSADAGQKKNVRPYLTLNVSGTLPMKVKQSTKAVRAVDMLAGDVIVSWKSSKPKVVSVSKTGKLKAKKKGKAVITVRTGKGAEASFTVKVKSSAVKTKKISVTAAGLIGKKLTVGKRRTLPLNIVITPLTSQDKLSYTISDKKVLSVSRKGLIKTKKTGKATVTIRSGKKKYVLKVTVK